MIGFANSGGIIASNIFVQTQAPGYLVGYGISLAVFVFCGIICSAFAVGLVMGNRKRERGGRDRRLVLPGSVLENIGDDDLGFGLFCRIYLSLAILLGKMFNIRSAETYLFEYLARVASEVRYTTGLIMYLSTY